MGQAPKLISPGLIAKSILDLDRRRFHRNRVISPISHRHLSRATFVWKLRARRVRSVSVAGPFAPFKSVGVDRSEDNEENDPATYREDSLPAK